MASRGSALMNAWMSVAGMWVAGFGACAATGTADKNRKTRTLAFSMGLSLMAGMLHDASSSHGRFLAGPGVRTNHEIVSFVSSCAVSALVVVPRRRRRTISDRGSDDCARPYRAVR